jgi:hypothetical protein
MGVLSNISMHDVKTKKDVQCYLIIVFVWSIIWLVFFGMACQKGTEYNRQMANSNVVVPVNGASLPLTAHTSLLSWRAFESQIVFPTFKVVPAAWRAMRTPVGSMYVNCSQYDPATRGRKFVPLSPMDPDLCGFPAVHGCVVGNKDQSMVMQRGNMMFAPIECDIIPYDSVGNPMDIPIFLVLCDNAAGVTQCDGSDSEAGKDVDILNMGFGNRVAIEQSVWHDINGKVVENNYQLSSNTIPFGIPVNRTNFYMFPDTFNIMHYMDRAHDSTVGLPPSTNGFDFWVFMTFMAGATYLCVLGVAGFWALSRKFMFPYSDIGMGGAGDINGGSGYSYGGSAATFSGTSGAAATGAPAYGSTA